MMSISGHIFIMIYNCVAILQDAKHYSSFVCLHRGILEVFKIMVSVSGQKNAPYKIK